MADDPFKAFTDTKNDPYDNAAAVIPDDANDLPFITRAIMISGGGIYSNVRMTFADGTTETMWLEQRRVYRFRVRRVHATGTFPPDSTYPKSIIALW